MATTKATFPPTSRNPSLLTSLNISANSNTADGDPDDYYDYDLSDHTVPLGELIPVALVYGLTLILGMSGNLLVIVVVARYRSMKNITNTFLLSLASADLLLVCICIPIKFAAFCSFSWTFGEFLCRGVSYLQNVSALCSVLTLMVMSAERYYAILHPMRAKYVCTVGRARRAILILWAVSLVLAMPIVFQTIHREVGSRYQAYWCVKNWDDTVHSVLYELYMLLVMLILPLSVMTFAYVGICYELWVMSSVRSAIASRGCSNGSEHAGSRLDSFSKKSTLGVVKGSFSASGQGKQARYTFRSSSSLPPSMAASPSRDHSERSPVLRVVRSDNQHVDDDRTRKQVIKMLVFVIAVFVICWAPLLVSNVLTAFGVLHSLNYGYLKPMRQVFYLLAYTNSCVNPVIYGFMSRHFRQTFLHAICTCMKGREYTQTLFLKRQNSFQTRSTNMGYSNDGSDLELTTVENPCGNCVGSSV